MDPWLEKFLAKRTTVTLFCDVDAPSPGFTTTTVTPAKEELGPGWAMDDVYPPLAELRRALLTDEEWALMSSWEKDVWEMYYRPDWERLACIEQILVDTPAAQREQRHEEILEALCNLGASATKSASAATANSCIVNLDTSHAVPIDMAPTTIEEGPEGIHSASTGVITTTATTCSTVCVARHPAAAPVLFASSSPIPFECILDTSAIHVEAVPLVVMGDILAVFAPMDSIPVIPIQQLYKDSEFSMPSSGQLIASKVPRPMPWPSFMGVHADGVESRPWPWPSFGEIGCEFPSNPVEKPYWLCNSDSSHAEICVATTFNISAFGGNLCTPTGYLIPHTYHLTLAWLSCNILVLCLLVMIRSLELKVLSIVPTAVNLPTVLLDSGNFALDFGYLGVHATVCIGTWLLVGSLRVCWKYSIHSSADYLIASAYGSQLLITLDCSHLKELVVLNSVTRPASSYDQLSCANQYTSYFPGYSVTSSRLDFIACSVLHRFLSGLLPSRHPVVMFGLQISKNVVETLCYELEESVVMDFSHVIELQAASAFAQLQWLSIVLMYSCGLIRLENLGLNWRFAHSASDRPALLIPIQSVAIPNIELWWYATALLTEISSMFSTEFSMQMADTGSVQPNTMRTHAIHHRNFGWEQLVLIVHRARFPVHRSATHLAVHSNCSADRMLDLGTNATWNSAYKYCMMVVKNSPFINLLLRQSDDIHLRLWPTHIFSPEDEFISKPGIFAHVMLQTDCHWCNFTKDQWLYFLLCDIPEADSSSMAICEVLLVHHQEMIHWQIAWQPYAHVCLSTIELSHTHDECCCFLGGYQGRLELLLFLEFDGQAVLQGGRHAPNSAICYLFHDNDIDFIHSLDYNGVKVMQVPWDPGGSDLLGFSTTTAWGQAVFQGGRGVSNPLHIMGRCCGLWPNHQHTPAARSHKLQVCIEKQRESHPSWIRRTRHGGGILSPTSALNPTFLFLLLPLHNCACIQLIRSVI